MSRRPPPASSSTARQRERRSHALSLSHRAPAILVGAGHPGAGGSTACGPATTHTASARGGDQGARSMPRRECVGGALPSSLTNVWSSAIGIDGVKDRSWKERCVAVRRQPERRGTKKLESAPRKKRRRPSRLDALSPTLPPKSPRAALRPTVLASQNTHTSIQHITSRRPSEPPLNHPRTTNFPFKTWPPPLFPARLPLFCPPPPPLLNKNKLLNAAFRSQS